MKLFYTILIFCFLCLDSLNGKNKIDSLKLILANATEDITQININIDLANVYFDRDIDDSAYHYASLGYVKSRKYKYLGGEARAAYILGKYFSVKGLFTNSTNYLQSAKQIYEQLHDKKALASCELQLGLIYYHAKKYEEAYNYFQSSLIISYPGSESKKTGLIFYLSGLCLTELNSLALAENSLNKAEAIYQTSKDSQEIMQCRVGLGNLYFKQKRFFAAKKNYESALTYFEGYGIKEGVANCFDGLGNIAMVGADMPKAMTYYKNAWSAAKSVNYVLVTEKVAKQLSDIYKANGDYKLAYTYLATYYEIVDSVRSADNIKAISNLSAELEMAKKQSEIDLLNKKHEVDKKSLYLLIAAVIVFLVIAIAYYMRSRYKIEANKQLSEINAVLESAMLDLKSTQDELLEQKNRELMRSNADLETFAFVASHDLNEPLRMVSNYTQLLAKRYHSALDEEGKEYIGFAVEGIHRIKKLISDLLIYFNIGRELTNADIVDCNQVLEEVLSGIKIHMDETQCRILADKLPVISGVRAQMGQVFHNIIENAIKYRSDEQPFIQIHAGRREKNWLFSFQDNGIGIDQAYKDKIYQLFQRLNERSKYPGSGVGLTVCKKIIELHGGTLWFESEPGKGTCFYFTIPVLKG
jgi:signal transduction histidine kinase